MCNSSLSLDEDDITLLGNNLKIDLKAGKYSEITSPRFIKSINLLENSSDSFVDNFLISHY